MKKRLNKKGFTLIELIVVIAVIGILVLLAAPKFLGYTRDAHVAAMKADAKILSNAALVYHIDNEVHENPEEWPIAYKTGALDPDSKVEKFTITVPAVMGGVDGLEEITAEKEVVVEGYKIDATKLDKKYIKNLKNKIEDYVLVVDGDDDSLVGDVFFEAGSTDRLGKDWFGVDLSGTKNK